MYGSDVAQGRGCSAWSMCGREGGDRGGEAVIGSLEGEAATRHESTGEAGNRCEEVGIGAGRQGSGAAR